MHLPKLLLPALFVLGCTFEPGHGFATVERASLVARIEPGPARDLGQSTLLSDLGYHVRLDSAKVTIEDVSLEELRATAGTAAFDPANPPPGYTSCHGGHCHAEDGRLVDYATIEAELAGGSASFAPVLVLPSGAAVDLLLAQPVPLERFEPSRELPRAMVRRIKVRASRIELLGTVSAGTSSPVSPPAPLRVGLTLASAWESGVNLAIDRDGPERIALEVTLTFGGRFFDGLEFAEHVSAGEIELSSSDHPLARALESSLAESSLELAID